MLELPPAPPASSAAARAVMQRNRRRNTAAELGSRRELHARGRRFLVDAPVPGTSRRRRADVLLRRQRVAVFVDGCFWYSCPAHLHLPRANRAWWRLKLASVVERDRETDAAVLAAGWWPLRVWEHEDVVRAADRVELVLDVRDGAAGGWYEAPSLGSTGA